MSTAVIAKRMRSLYRSKCKVCAAGIAPGDTIALALNGSKQWVCTTCADKIERNKPIEYVQSEPEIDAGPLAARIEALEKSVCGLAESVVNTKPGDLAGLEKLAKVAGKAVETLAKYDARLKALEENKPRTIEVKVADRPTVKLDGVVHRAFDKVLRLAVARKPVFLPGPAGCGKSHLAACVAKALGLRFRSISCTAGMSEGHLTGRLLPIGDAGKFEFVNTGFLECYEHGGVFLLDEMDAADPNVLLIINSAIANGLLEVLNRPGNPIAKMHADFVLIAAANTFGTGADRLYVGRARLDESTLDRFRIGTVPMDYDPKVEESLCPDTGLRELLQKFRKNVAKARLERVVSTRFMRDAADMMQAGMTIEEVQEQLFQGWRSDEITKATAA